MRFVNLTPHEIDFQFSDGSRVAFQSDGLARVDVIDGICKEIVHDGKKMPVCSPLKYGRVEGLPEPEENVIYIVSQIILTQPSVAGRADVVAPATGPKDGAIRYVDGPRKGQIEAVTRWVAA